MFQKPSHARSDFPEIRLWSLPAFLEPSLVMVRRRAFTLVELLIVVAVIGIFAGIALTRFEPSFHEQLRGTAQVVVSDLGYARSLAVANNSSYRFTFEPERRRYWLHHTGTNTAFNTLPAFPYRDPADPPTRQTTDFSRLVSLGGGVELAAVRHVTSTTQAASSFLELGPLGSLTHPEDCWIWLSLGNHATRYYLPIEVHAVTGLARIGEIQMTGPPPLQAAAVPPSGNPVPAPGT